MNKVLVVACAVVLILCGPASASLLYQYDTVTEAFTIPDSGNVLEMFNTGDGMTVATWITPSHERVNDYFGIVGKNPTKKYRWAFSLEFSKGAPQDTMHWLQPYNSKNVYGTFNAVHMGERTHIAWTMETRETDYEIKFYVNGELDVVATCPREGPTPYNPGIDIVVGKYNDQYNKFPGVMEDLRIYDEVLTEQQIAALIPEPATLGLMAMAFVALRLRRRRPR